MPNDAKLGLVCGVGLVIVVAVVFFRKDGSNGAAPADPAAIGKPSVPAPPATPEAEPRPAPARPGLRQAGAPAAAVSGRRHTVRAGDTLFHLARYYLGDGAKSDRIVRVNPQLAGLSGPLPPGTVLVIPDAEEGADGPESPSFPD
jgi:nucleoid-associated protein YgaU